MNRRNAFTLVELLVVVAIIALLLAIVFPSLDRARRHALRVKCATNLRQLGHAFHMYAHDYRGMTLPLAYWNSPNSPSPTYWWGRSEPLGVDYTKGFTWPYLRSELRQDAIFECPIQRWETYDIVQGQSETITSTYGYNGYFLCPPHSGWERVIGDRPWQNLDVMNHPQEVFVFADTMVDWGGQLKNSALLDPPMLYLGDRDWRRNSMPTTSFRHEGLTNAVHADGHVASLPPGDGGIESDEYGIGSVGTENDPHYVPDWRDW